MQGPSSVRAPASSRLLAGLVNIVEVVMVVELVVAEGFLDLPGTGSSDYEDQRPGIRR
jgi:hypothetical protein